MKFNKKLFSGVLAGTLLVSSLSYAANETRKLVATYGVSLNVNGSVFTVDDSTMRPFITSDGRTYVSIAALQKMNIANVSFDRNTKVVTVNSNGITGGANNSQLQAQISAQVAEISRLQNENNQLKAELAKKNNSSSSNSNTNSSSSEFSKLSSSERRNLARDIDRELRSVRASTKFFRSQKFASSTEITSKSVVINLYQDYQLSADDLKNWNDLATGRRASELEDEYADFLRYDIMDALKGVLKGYSGYNVEVIIYSVVEPTGSTSDLQKAEMVNMSYSYSRDKFTASVYSTNVR